MTNTNKLTNKQFNEMTIAEKHLVVYAILKSVGAAQEVLDFEKDRAEKAMRKSANAKSKMTAKQIEAEALRASVLEYLTTLTEPTRASEVAEALQLSSPQKATALLTRLVDDKKIVRDYVGKVAYFKVN